MKPSRNNFPAYVREQAMMPSMCLPREVNVDDLDGYRRTKVEDNLEIDNDLSKISERRNVEEADNIWSWGATISLNSLYLENSSRAINGKRPWFILVEEIRDWKFLRELIWIPRISNINILSSLLISITSLIQVVKEKLQHCCLY